MTKQIPVTDPAAVVDGVPISAIAALLRTLRNLGEYFFSFGVTIL